MSIHSTPPQYHSQSQCAKLHFARLCNAFAQLKSSFTVYGVTLPSPLLAALGYAPPTLGTWPRSSFPSVSPPNVVLRCSVATGVEFQFSAAQRQSINQPNSKSWQATARNSCRLRASLRASPGALVIDSREVINDVKPCIGTFEIKTPNRRKE